MVHFKQSEANLEEKYLSFDLELTKAVHVYERDY